MAVTPLAVSMMLSCYYSTDPQNEVGAEVWNSPSGVVTRAFLKDKKLIDDKYRATDLGSVWVEAICKTPFPVPTVFTEDDKAFAQVVEVALAKAGLSVTKLENMPTNLGITPSLALARMLRLQSKKQDTPEPLRVGNLLMATLMTAAPYGGSTKIQIDGNDAAAIIAELQALHAAVADKTRPA